jgi:hypothetical protein
MALFFESFGAGFQAVDSELDTFGMGSPAEINPIREVCVFKERAAE